MLDRLKKTVARVELDGKPNGSAFLVGRKHVVTAAHVLEGQVVVRLVFMEWEKADRQRSAKRIWRHPAGYDLAILELESPCPDDVEPVRWSPTRPAVGDAWLTFGYPAQVPGGHPLTGRDERVADPERLVDAWDLRIMQLYTLSAYYDLRGFSGAPCLVDGAIAGVITHQLRRSLSDGTEKVEDAPALDTVFALPMTLLEPSGLVSLPTDDGNPQAVAGPSDQELVSRTLEPIVNTLLQRFYPEHAGPEGVRALVERLKASTGHDMIMHAKGYTIGGGALDMTSVIEAIALRVARPELFGHGLFYLSKSKLLELAESTHKAVFDGAVGGRGETAMGRLERIQRACLTQGQVRFVVWPPERDLNPTADELYFIVAELVMVEPNAARDSFLVSPRNQVLEARSEGEPPLTMSFSRKHMLVSSMNHLGLDNMVKGEPEAVLACGFLMRGDDSRFRLHALGVELLHLPLPVSRSFTGE